MSFDSSSSRPLLWSSTDLINALTVHPSYQDRSDPLKKNELVYTLNCSLASSQRLHESGAIDYLSIAELKGDWKLTPSNATMYCPLSLLTASSIPIDSNRTLLILHCGKIIEDASPSSSFKCELIVEKDSGLEDAPVLSVFHEQIILPQKK